MALLYTNLGEMRKPYNQGNTVFTEDQLVSKEPFGQFAAWFDEACHTDNIFEANAMCIATASKDGVPSARMVLLKGFNEEGFVFYTKYTSQKGMELLENPKASLCFYWEALKRSIRIMGDVKKVPETASTEYFDTRPRASQLAACASTILPKVIASRDELVVKTREIEEGFHGKDVTRPQEWGGYIVVPHQFEFWQGQSTRSHDRIIFRRKIAGEQVDPALTKEGEDDWVIERWSP